MSVEEIRKKRMAVKPKPYVMKVDRKTGSLYLQRQRPPFIGELPYMTALLVAVVFAVLSCCQYIQLHTRAEYHIRQTEILERQYQLLKNENTLLERTVYQTPDLGEIYTVAVNELGMVPATEKHIRLFERSDREFVYQTDNIPHFGF